MTDCNITTITTDNAITTVSFNVASLAAGNDMEAVARQISDFITKQKPKNLIVDFSGVKFFSSQTLGVLIDARKKMAAIKANMVISGINPQLYRVFKITNLDKLFVFYPEAQTAAGELTKGTKN